MEGRDPYRILQVHPEADPDVIKAAYRVLARKLHPDGRAGSPLGPAAERKMAELNWAYGVLRSAEARADYDRGRRFGGPATPASAPTHGAPRPDAAYDSAETPLDFGRYAGWTLREVARRDIDYLRWLSRQTSGARHRSAIAAILREHDRGDGTCARQR
ncbi:MAG: DnaJ domain-containing protein [Candidatus Limnocylindria bacterium]